MAYRRFATLAIILIIASLLMIGAHAAVESISDQPIHTQDVSSLISGISPATYHINGVAWSVTSYLDATRVPAKDARCSINDGMIMCEITTTRGEGNVYCWGSGAARECPGTDIGTHIIMDSRARDDRIEVPSYAWGRSVTDPDDDTVTLEYVWFIPETHPVTRITRITLDEPASIRAGTPAETLSLSFTKIEMATDGQTAPDGTIDIPSSGAKPGTILLTRITFENEARNTRGTVCTLAILLAGGDCDDDDPVITPGAVADTWRDPDDDGDGIPSAPLSPPRAYLMLDTEWDSLSESERLSAKNTLIATNRAWNPEQQESVRTYLSTITELSGADLGLAIAYNASGNERVRDIMYDPETETLTVTHEEDVRLFWLVRVPIEARTTIDAQGRVTTRYPWYAIGPKSNTLRQNPLYNDADQVRSNPLYEG